MHVPDRTKASTRYVWDPSYRSDRSWSAVFAFVRRLILSVRDEFLRGEQTLATWSLMLSSLLALVVKSCCEGKIGTTFISHLL